jgi:hypothetical protein
MARETTYAGQLGDLQRFKAALEANIAEVPHLQGTLERVGVLLAQGQETANRQLALAASKQETSKQLKTLVTEGQRVATAARALLKEHYGLRSEKLASSESSPSEAATAPARRRPRPRSSPPLPRCPPSPEADPEATLTQPRGSVPSTLPLFCASALPTLIPSPQRHAAEASVALAKHRRSADRSTRCRCLLCAGEASAGCRSIGTLSKDPPGCRSIDSVSKHRQPADPSASDCEPLCYPATSIRHYLLTMKEENFHNYKEGNRIRTGWSRSMFILILIYVLFALPALVWLARRRLDQLPQALWALVVVAVPVMGAIALVLVQPGEPRTPAKTDSEFELDEFRRQ